MTKIYVASSWRNTYQPIVVNKLREHGFNVYDFKRDGGFRWSSIDPNWQCWNFEEYLNGLKDPKAIEGFMNDYKNMKESDICVLVLPCGSSAHLEAGYFTFDSSRHLIIYIPPKEIFEPELMYKLADYISNDIDKIIDYIDCLEVK